MSEKRIVSCGVQCPPARDPLHMVEKIAGAGAAARIPGVDAGGHDMLVGQRNIDAFWETMPWGDAVTYLSRSGSVAWGPNPVQADVFVVPAGVVVALTSIVFRIKTPVDGNKYVYLRDDYLVSDDLAGCHGMFYPQINNRAIVSRTSVSFTTNTIRSGYFLLNTSIQTPEVPFYVFAQPNSTVQVLFEVHPFFSVPASTIVGADIEGFSMPKKLYDELRQKFNVNK